MTAEANFLLGCLRQEEIPIPSSVNWDELFLLAESHGVLPAFCRNFAQRPIDGSRGLPPKFANHFRAEWTHSLFLARELRELLDRFAVRGIEALPLKGPALAEYLYGHVAARSFHDLDILVRPQDFTAAHSVLLELGFAEPGSANDYHSDYFRGQTLVELHFAIAPPFALGFDMVAAWKRTRQIPFFGAPAPFFSPIDLILYLSLHGVKHRFARLIWVLDLARAMEDLNPSDASRLLEEATAQRLRNLVLTSSAIVRRCFNVVLPDDIAAALANQPNVASQAAAMADQILLEIADPTTSPHDASRYLHLADGAGARWSQRLQFFVPTIEDYRWMARYRVPGKYAVLVRPFRLLWKYGPAPALRTLFSRAAADPDS